MLCVLILYISGWTYRYFKVDSERQIFEKLFMAILFTLRAFARNLLSEEITEEISVSLHKTDRIFTESPLPTRTLSAV